MCDMDKDAVIAAIRAAEPAFRARGVTHVWLFGSVARGDAGPESDVDLFFEHEIERFGLVGYSGLKRLANEILPFDVDFIERGCLDRRIRARVEAMAEQVF
jgi:uncharacterized protein